MEQKTLDLIYKLKALAERGIGGEKTNAAFALDRILKKHGLTLQDIEEEKKQYEVFKFNTEEKRMFVIQVIASVLGKKFKHYKNPKSYEVYITKADFIEISEKIDFFWKLYQDEKEVFWSAFVQVNQLYCKPDETEEGEEKPVRKHSPEEIEKMKRAALMGMGIKTGSPKKKIEG